MRPWLLIDYDDTLGGVLIDGEVQANQTAYSTAITKFNKYMEILGYDPIQSETIRDTTDRFLIRKQGFGEIGHFAESMCRTLKAMASKKGSRASKKTISNIRDIGMEVFEYRYMPLPGALSTLHSLHPHYRIAVVTKGEYREQKKKVMQSGVHSFIDDVFVMGYKNQQEWTDLFTHLRIGPIGTLKAWAVGNAIRSDINIPIAMGTNGIHLQLEDTWTFEEEAYVTPHDGQELHIVSHVAEILNYLNWS